MTKSHDPVSEVAKVAAGLTKAQRETLVEGRSCGRSYLPAQKLVELGLWYDSDDEYTIWPRYTPTGLAVRTLLQDQSHAD